MVAVSQLDDTVSTDAGVKQRKTLTYNPALDGIRGLAVAAVLAFHGGFEWASGGFLGVSTFFTLSGFLITTLLLTEHRSTGRINLLGFWSRRMRRLLPAATATLGLVTLSALVTDEGWERALPGDVVASLAQVANWRFLFEDRAYAALFELPSPVLHFWSLAIEEQFYWLFPALAMGVLALTRGSRRAFAGMLGGLLAISVLLTVLADGNFVYYATPVRMGEIVIGALLAVVLAANGERLSQASWRVRFSIGVVGLGALAASAAAWQQLDLSSAVLEDGGLLAYALASGAVVLAASVTGPVRSLLSVAPLRLLGVISYGVYLIHWPLFQLLDADRADSLVSPFGLEVRGAKSLFAVQVAVTLVLAVLSYHFFEQPIRKGRRPKLVPAPALAAGSALAVLAATVVVPRLSEPPEDMFAVAQENTIECNVATPPADLAEDGGAGITVGDSTLLMTSWGLSTWGVEEQRIAIPCGVGGLGCAFGRGGEVDYRGNRGRIEDGCPGGDWEALMPETIAQARDIYGDQLTFVLLQAGPWDVAERRLEGDDRWLHIGDEDYDDFLRDEMATATDLVLDEGLVAVWLTAPYLRASGEESLSTDAESDPARMTALNEMVRGVAADRDGAVVVDLAAWVAGLPEAEDERLRPDGVHFDVETSGEVGEVLGPDILEAVASVRSG